CHSGNRTTSVIYANAASGGTETSTLDTIGAMATIPCHIGLTVSVISIDGWRRTIVTNGEQFEAHREHLHAVAYRMLGSLAEADDAVQEAWLRLHRAA